MKNGKLQSNIRFLLQLTNCTCMAIYEMCDLGCYINWQGICGCSTSGTNWAFAMSRTVIQMRVSHLSRSYATFVNLICVIYRRYLKTSLNGNHDIISQELTFFYKKQVHKNSIILASSIKLLRQFRFWNMYWLNWGMYEVSNCAFKRSTFLQ